MTGFVRAMALSDIPNGRGKLWRHGDKRIAVFRTASGAYAADNRCPHQGKGAPEAHIFVRRGRAPLPTSCAGVRP